MCIRDSDITADELLSGAGGNTATKTEQAERLILDLLADGKELASEDIVKAAAEAGISERTVQNLSLIHIFTTPYSSAEMKAAYRDTPTSAAQPGASGLM